MRARGAGRRGATVSIIVFATLLLSGVSEARADAAGCSHVVVFTLPGVTWSDVQRVRPPAILDAVARGAAGSVAVRTIASRTTYASGFATIGAGSRLDGGITTGGAAEVERHSKLRGSALVDESLTVGNVTEVQDLARAAGYGAKPGALATALGSDRVVAIGNADPGAPPPIPLRPGQWALLAAMDEGGTVAHAVTDEATLQPDPVAPYGVKTDSSFVAGAARAALSQPCSTVIVDPGDLERADEDELSRGISDRSERDAALLSADRILGRIAPDLDPTRDLLLIVSPSSPAWDPAAHLGVAIAVGPEFSPGTTLDSASTRRAGLVTLPDVAPAILKHQGVVRPAAMDGRPWYSVDAHGANRIETAVALDREAVFVDRMQPRVTTTFVVLQVLLYILAVVLLVTRERRGRPLTGGPIRVGLEVAALALVAFPVGTYIGGLFPQHSLGPWLFPLALVAIDALLVAAVSWAFTRPLDRLLALAAGTVLVLAADLIAGGRLQLDTVFGYSPIVAGRFQGIGNLAFAVLAAATVLTGTLIVHRWRGPGALAAVAAVFVVAVVVDGAPQLGSDVGGVIALVPGLAITWVLLSGRRPSWKLVGIGALAAAVALGAFLALDLARPPEARTHLARLFLDVRSQGWHVLTDTIVRKARANFRVFHSTVWTLLVPPALAVIAWLLVRPRGRWGRLAEIYPRVRAGLVGGLIVAILGFATNDSGIVIPAVVLGFLVPTALLIHLSLEASEAA